MGSEDSDSIASFTNNPIFGNMDLFYDHDAFIEMNQMSSSTEISSSFLIQQIENELRNLTISTCDYHQTGQLSYRCKFIFFEATLLNLVLGESFLSRDPSTIEVKTESIRPDDIFIKCGMFVKLLKRYLITQGFGHIKKKYFESNTYVVSLKVGVKTLPINEEQESNLNPRTGLGATRCVSYVKLRDCLWHVQQALQGLTQKLPQQPRRDSEPGSISTYNKTESMRMCANILANRIVEIESQIAAFLKENIAFSTMSDQGVIRAEKLLTEYIEDSEVHNSVEINKAKRNIRSEDDLTDSDYGQTHCLEKCLQDLREYKIRRQL